MGALLETRAEGAPELIDARDLREIVLIDVVEMAASRRFLVPKNEGRRARQPEASLPLDFRTTVASGLLTYWP